MNCKESSRSKFRDLDLLLYQNRKCGSFMLLFCRGRHGTILKCVPHVQHAYFSLIIFLICVFSLPCRRHCESYPIQNTTKQMALNLDSLLLSENEESLPEILPEEKNM